MTKVRDPLAHAQFILDQDRLLVEEAKRQQYLQHATYKTVCVSIYKDDLEAIDEKVRELRARGHAMSRSQLLRLAVSMLDVDALDAEATRRGRQR